MEIFINAFLSADRNWREKHDKNENYTCLIKQELALRAFKRLLTMSEYIYMKHKIAKVAINKDGIINLYFLTNAQ